MLAIQPSGSVHQALAGLQLRPRAGAPAAWLGIDALKSLRLNSAANLVIGTTHLGAATTNTGVLGQTAPNLYWLDGNRFAVFYAKSGNIYARVLTYTGTDITAGTEQEVIATATIRRILPHKTNRRRFIVLTAAGAFYGVTFPVAGAGAASIATLLADAYTPASITGTTEQIGWADANCTKLVMAAYESSTYKAALFSVTPSAIAYVSGATSASTALTIGGSGITEDFAGNLHFAAHSSTLTTIKSCNITVSGAVVAIDNPANLTGPVAATPSSAMKRLGGGALAYATASGDLRVALIRFTPGAAADIDTDGALIDAGMEESVQPDIFRFPQMGMRFEGGTNVSRPMFFTPFGPARTDTVSTSPLDSIQPNGTAVKLDTGDVFMVLMDDGTNTYPVIWDASTL